MNWNRQMEEMMQSWTDMQRRMWNNWVESVNKFSSEMPEGGLQSEYRKQLEAWEASVEQALDAQTDWARKLSEQMKSDPSAPDAIAQWNGQLQEMMKGWTDSQQQLWAAWFESMRTMAPGQDVGQWGQESKQVLEAWQQAAERAQETLANWTRQVQAAQPAPQASGKGGTKSAGGSSSGRSRGQGSSSRTAKK